MIRHHPSPALILRCAGGHLPAAHEAVIKAHLTRCAACRAALDDAMAVGGVLLDETPKADLAPGALEAVLARLDRPLPPPAPTRIGLDGLAAPARKWRRVAPGIATLSLAPRDATGTRLDMLRVAPGAGLLSHGHHGLETLCVLQGAFDDGIERYAAGDFAEADEALDHRPVALPGEDCLCLFATTGFLKPHGLLGRLVRPLLGM